MSKTTEKILHDKDLIKIARLIEKLYNNPVNSLNRVISILEMEFDEDGDVMQAFFEIKKIIEGAK